VPNALLHFLANLDPLKYDSSGLGPGLDVMAENQSLLTREVAELSNATRCIFDRSMTMLIKNSVNHVHRVQFLLLGVFCQLLIIHFSILFSQNEIVWPECKCKNRKTIALTY
jgi:hypothetical protein